MHGVQNPVRTKDEGLSLHRGTETQHENFQSCSNFFAFFIVDPHICHIRLTYFLCWKGFCWISKHLSAILPKNLSRDIKATVLHPQTCPIFPLLWLTEGYNLLSTLKKDRVRILSWLLLISKLEMGIQVFFNPQTDHAHRL